MSSLQEVYCIDCLWEPINEIGKHADGFRCSDCLEKRRNAEERATNKKVKRYEAMARSAEMRLFKKMRRIAKLEEARNKAEEIITDSEEREVLMDEAIEHLETPISENMFKKRGTPMKHAATKQANPPHPPAKESTQVSPTIDTPITTPFNQTDASSQTSNDFGVSGTMRNIFVKFGEKQKPRSKASTRTNDNNRGRALTNPPPIAPEIQKTRKAPIATKTKKTKEVPLARKTRKAPIEQQTPQATIVPEAQQIQQAPQSLRVPTIAEILARSNVTDEEVRNMLITVLENMQAAKTQNVERGNIKDAMVLYQEDRARITAMERLRELSIQDGGEDEPDGDSCEYSDTDDESDEEPNTRATIIEVD